MKKVSILICTLALVYTVGFAQTLSLAPLPNEILASILSPPATLTTACPPLQGAATEFGTTVCDICADTGSCFFCCRCSGGSREYCSAVCSEGAAGATISN
jgi:hypothetical protein